MPQATIARRLGLTKSTVAYHTRRAVPPDPKFRRRYDWVAVQAFYDACHAQTDTWGGRNKGRRLRPAARGQDGRMTEHPENTEDEPAGQAESEGPDAAELDQDPAYEPEDEGLKDIKGG